MEKDLTPVCYTVEENENSVFIKENDDRLNKKYFEAYFSTPKYVSFIYLILGSLTLISIILIVIGVLLLNITSNSLSKFLIFFGSLSFVVNIFGFFAYFNYCKIVMQNITNKTETPETYQEIRNLEISNDRALVNFSLYLNIFLFVVYLILSMVCLMFTDQIIVQIKSRAISKNDFIKNFKSMDIYDYTISQVNIYLIVLGSLALMNVILKLCLFYCYFKIFFNYRIVISLVCYSYIIYFGVGLISMYYSIFLWNYDSSVRLAAHLPTWISLALFSLSVFILLFGLIGFYSSQNENTDVLKLISIIVGGISLMTFILAIIGEFYLRDFKNFYKGNCNNLLPFVHENYLTKVIQCDSKYIHFEDDVEKLSLCPKERIATVWERKIGKSEKSYGCLNLKCCVNYYEMLISKIEYVILAGFLLFILGIITVVGSCYIVRRISAGIEFGINDKKLEYLFSFILIVMISVFLFFSCLIPSKPESLQMFEDLKINEDITNKTSIDKKFIKYQSLEFALLQTKNEIFKQTNFSQISVDSQLCINAGICFDYRYFVEITSNNANLWIRNLTLALDKHITPYTISNGVAFYTNSSLIINNLQNIFDFQYKCPFEATKINIKLDYIADRTLGVKNTTLKQKPNQNPASNIFPITLSNDISNPELNLNKVVLKANPTDAGTRQNIYQKEYDFTVIGTNKIIITGKAPKGTTISLYLKGFPGCDSIYFTSDNNGNFASTPVLTIVNNPKIEVSINASSPGYNNYSQSLIIGGLMDNLVYVGILPLIQSSRTIKNSNLTFSFSVVDSIEFRMVPLVRCYVYKGYKNFQNSLISFETVYNHENEDFIDLFYSTNQGYFKTDDIFNLESHYTIVILKKKYYREIIHLNPSNIQSYNNSVFPLTQVTRKGDIRFVLHGNHLDLYNFFEAEKNKACELYFGLKACGRSILIQSKEFDIQTMTIRNILDTNYTIAVNKFVDNSTIYLGENDVFNYNHSYFRYKNIIKNPTIKIYSHNYLDPIKIQEIPDFNKTETKNQWIILYCLDGNQGINGIETINSFKNQKPSQFCGSQNSTTIKQNLIQISSNKIKN